MKCTAKVVLLFRPNISKRELIWAVNSNVTFFLQKPIKYSELVERLDEIELNR